MIGPDELFDLKETELAGLFDGLSEVWTALDRIKSFTREMVAGRELPLDSIPRMGETVSQTVVIFQGNVLEDGFRLLGGDPTKGQMRVEIGGEAHGDAVVIHAGAVFMDRDIHLGPGAVVEPGALIKGPTYIGPGTEVRQGAYLRGSVLVGRGCVVGHTTEVKNSVFLDGAKAGHFAYVGDSILGRGVNLGAGTKLANLKLVESCYHMKVDGQDICIDRRKFGAILGDGVETGCNSVTNPGTVMGPRCLVAPCVSVKAGYHPPRTILR